MTTNEAGLPYRDIVTAGCGVIPLPAGLPIIDPGLDDQLDPHQFQKGFKDATARLDTFPSAWARHHASSTMALVPDPDEDNPSWMRGYRAALYGYLRHSTG